MKKLLFATLLMASNAWAGKFEIVGEGTATREAEFLKIGVLVKTECATSALQARKNTDELADKVLKALEPFESGLPDQKQVAPGSNHQSPKSKYVNNQHVVICDEQHAWTSSTSIQFRLTDLKKVAEVQDLLLQLNPGDSSREDLNKMVTVLSSATPTPGVNAETWDAMSDLALQRAKQNALRQVKVLMDNPTDKIELQKVSVTKNVSGQPIYDRVDEEGDTAGIGLGKVSVKVARQFTYKVGP